MTNMVIIIGVVILIVLTATLYLIVSHKFMSRPIWFIIVGFTLCLFSAVIISITETLNPLIQATGLSPAFSILKNTFSLTIASLGGALISSGIVTKAQIDHNRRKYILNNRLRITSKTLDAINSAKNKAGDTWGDKEHTNYISSLLKYTQEKMIIITELEQMGWIDRNDYNDIEQQKVEDQL